MSSTSCAHLHVHSEYSLLDGACKIDALAERAARFGQPALGLTDHGVMNGAVELYKACRKNGIKPIVGCEIYLVDDHTASGHGRTERNHLTLLAADDAGYRNLVKLSSAGFLEGLQRGKPTVDLAQVELHSAGVIALTGCLASRFCQRLLEDRDQEARAHADDLLRVFGPENVYFEIQKNGLAAQDKCNEGIVRIAGEVDGRLVGTGDVHYLGREDYEHHTALLCVQTKSTIAEPKLTFETNEFYLRDSEEMASKFAQWPEAIASTLEIAERCSVELELGKQLIPRYPTPDGSSEREFLRARVQKGLRLRYGDPPPATAVERMEMELDVIDRMGFNAYFLIVWDFVTFAKDNGIAVGPGRGSAAGSIVSYCLAITDIDPLRYDLLFERFLNPERVSMPDIDIDFSVRGRERVMRYVADKYGRESVAQIVTFGKMFPRAATRDAARVLGFDYGTGDRLAKLIPDPIMGRAPSFEECLKDGQPLRKACDEDPTAKQIIDVAQGLEGIVRNSSIHAAAVVIADRPLTDIVPLQLADAGTDESGERAFRTVTQFSMKPIEEIGILKMDFLGLRNLDVIEDALDIIERSTGARPDWTEVPLDDQRTYEMLARGDSTGVFQFESEGMREALKKVRPDEFNDLVALNALYRPGAMDQIPVYARGKHNPESISYADERLRPILESSNGVILYQEQAMQISKELAGFSGAKADDLRKAIGKKNRVAMAELKPEFVEGCRASGTSEAVIDFLWTTNERSADYSFNKCAHGATRVRLADNRRIRLSEAYRLQPSELMAMWPDGTIKPHRVARIVKTGRKPMFQVRTRSGRQIKVTAEHRLLTTEGYMPVSDMRLGTELITAPVYTDAERRARSERMTRLARRPERRAQDQRAAARMRAWQEGRSAEEKAEHMRRVHVMYPDLTKPAIAAMHARVAELRATDPEWVRQHTEASIASVRATYDTGPGFGRCSIASNGMWCASSHERAMCEWLIEQGIEFEMHKVLPHGRICDFYFAGIYWEMDGMDRADCYFAEKYGELPYVVVTPEDFKAKVAMHVEVEHAANGDPIVSIVPCGTAVSYDVEMEHGGPLNFVANNIVSHNSHAACYGLIAYRTAWLKANYTAEYMAALISSVMSTKDKVPFFVARCEEMGIEILPPDVNLSDHEFTVEVSAADGAGTNGGGLGNIRFGLDAVKGVGHQAVEAIKRAREQGREFTSLWDFCERVDSRTVNKKAIEALVKCGALGSTGASRKGMLAVLEQAQANGQKMQQDALIGQGSIFDLQDGLTGLDGGASADPSGSAGGAPAGAGLVRPVHPPIPTEEFEQPELLAAEKEAIGLFVSAHPLKPLREALRARVDCSISALEDRRDKDLVTVGGIITETKRIRTRNGDHMMFATLDDLAGSVEMLVFGKALTEHGAALAVDEVVVVKGRVDHKEAGKTCLVVQTMESFAPSPEEIERARAQAQVAARTATALAQPLKLRIRATDLSANTIEDLKQMIEDCQGTAEVLVEIDRSDGTTHRVRLGEGYRVRHTPTLCSELQNALPRAGVVPADPLPSASAAAG